ncbi:MAG: ABC transporter permease [Desulfovibrio sp.]|jgi:putative ABC transport system permease protein|nr:ABC transporter permease [Desulfovibrio sp.]
MWNLALKNLKGHKAYNVFIVLAVALAVTMALTAVFTSGGIQGELERNRLLTGADLALVPTGTKETGQVDLAKGPPVRGVVPGEAAEQLKTFSDVDVVTPQKYRGEARVGDVLATLVSFAPATDFVVLPWLEGKAPGEWRGDSGEIVLGARVGAGKVPGDVLEVDGGKFSIAGRLRETGTFLDTAIFFPVPGETIPDPSWLLVRLRKDAFPDFTVNMLETNIARVEVIARPEMLKTINDQLHGLLQGGGFRIATVFVAFAVFLVTGAMFALTVHERRREFGLLKAMGAENAFVFRLIVGEAALLAGAGSLLGIVCSAAWLAAAGAVPSEGSALSSMGFALARMVLILLLTVAVGVLAALYPALRARSLEPYAAIRGGE